MEGISPCSALPTAALAISLNSRPSQRPPARWATQFRQRQHGNNGDNRRAVETLLDDAEQMTQSVSAIAKVCAVGEKTVAAHRAAIFRISENASTPRTVERGGKTHD